MNKRAHRIKLAKHLLIPTVLIAVIFLAISLIVHYDRGDVVCPVQIGSDGGMQIENTFGWPKAYLTHVEYSECDGLKLSTGGTGSREGAYLVAYGALAYDFLIFLLVGIPAVGAVAAAHVISTPNKPKSKPKGRQR